MGSRVQKRVQKQEEANSCGVAAAADRLLKTPRAICAATRLLWRHGRRGHVSRVSLCRASGIVCTRRCGAMGWSATRHACPPRGCWLRAAARQRWTEAICLHLATVARICMRPLRRHRQACPRQVPCPPPPCAAEVFALDSAHRVGRKGCVSACAYVRCPSSHAGQGRAGQGVLLVAGACLPTFMH